MCMKKKRGLVSCIQEFKKDTILTPIFVIGEVAFDVLIPMMTGRLLTQGVEAGNMERIFYYGGIVVLMALAALLLGALSGRYAARAATGFSRNLRREMYRNVQKFSFSNIDKFSTGGIITRLTTDVTNVQMAFKTGRRTAGNAGRCNPSRPVYLLPLHSTGDGLIPCPGNSCCEAWASWY